jgi:hypothetical protein
MLNPIEILKDLFAVASQAFKEFEEAQNQGIAIDTTPLAGAVLALIDDIGVKLPDWINLDTATKTLNVVFSLLKQHKEEYKAKQDAPSEQ